ncbi:MAG: trigger factor [Gemmatimonadota bacterium]
MTLDASRLQISVQEEEAWRRRLSVTIPASLVREEEHKAARSVASRLKMKGFRKGRVPASVVESRFGAQVRQEAIDRLINDAYRTALEAEELRPISDGELEELIYEPEAGSDLIFSIAFDVQPLIELSRLGGFAVERPRVEIGDEHVDEMLNRLREQNGTWVPVEEGRPGDHDLVAVRIRRLDGEEGDSEGKEYEFVLGQGDAIPDIEEAIKSLEVGGSGDFTATFPDDFPAEERRGEQEQVEITLLGRKVLELPELDDEFARQVGDFETLDELRAKVREDLERDAERQAESVVRGRLLDFLMEANPFQVPRSMVEHYIDSILGEQNLEPERLEELKESLRPEAERAVKRLMIIERVAETQELRATSEEVDAKVEGIAEKSGSTAARVYATLQKSGHLDALEREITEDKVFDFLKEQSEITEAPAA